MNRYWTKPLILIVALIGPLPCTLNAQQVDFCNAQLLTPEFGQSWDQYSEGIALSNDWVAISSPGSDVVALNAGVVSMFRRLGEELVHYQDIWPTDIGPHYSLGWHLEFGDEHTLFVAAANIAPGAVHVFEFDDTDWIETQRLEPPDVSDGFGFSFAVEDDVLVIGAKWERARGDESGAAYVFREIGDSWDFEARLVPPNLNVWNRFGITTDISEGRLLVGSENGRQTYVFRNEGGEWIIEQQLIPDDGSSSRAFGSSVAIEGNTAFVGASEDDDLGPATGSVYQFEFDGSEWNQVREIYPTKGEDGDLFGSSLALRDGLLCVGASGSDTLFEDAGRMYLYEVLNGQVQELDTFDPLHVESSSLLGHSVAFDGLFCLAGARGGGSETGSAYFIQVGCQSCPADLTGSSDPSDDTYGIPDGDVDADDFFFYLDAFANGEIAICDIDMDGDCDAADFFGYLDFFVVGC